MKKIIKAKIILITAATLFLAGFYFVSAGGGYFLGGESGQFRDWKTSNGYMEMAASSGYDLLLKGATATSTRYLNFGLSNGTDGFGFKNDAGTMYFKNYGGSWTAIGTGSGGSATTTISGVIGPDFSFLTGTSGSNFNIATSTGTITFNIPNATSTATGLLTSSDWSSFNARVPYTGATTNLDLGLNEFRNIASKVQTGELMTNTSIWAGSNVIFSSYNDYTTPPTTIGSIQMTDADTFEIQGSQTVKLWLGDMTGLQSFSFPDQSGTLALTSDLPDISGKANVELNNLGTTAINAHLLFDTNAAYDIGSTTAGINDLHLGSGGVINWANGDVFLTHSAGNLTLSNGADLTLQALSEFIYNFSTASTIAGFSATKRLVSLDTATYPSLTELSYVKGVTSAIQTQLNGKANTALSNLASVAINTSLISDTDSTDDLGSSSIYWANTYTDNLYLNPTAYFSGGTAGFASLTGGLTATDDLNIGSGILFVDVSAKRVGINTTAPTVPLEIISEEAGLQVAYRNFAASVSGAVMRVYKGRGTYASPLRARSGDTLGGVNAFGYYAADDATTATQGTVGGQFLFITEEAWTSTGQGTYFRLGTTPAGSTTMTPAFAVTGAQNVKVGIQGATINKRATTEGTNHLDIFDGTAPVGTLTNGISIYSSSGEGYMMDAAGNATLQTPHDDEGNWIFYSKNTKTGKVLRIDMEKMMKFLNKEFGTDFIQEYFEATNYPGQNNQHINKITN